MRKTSKALAVLAVAAACSHVALSPVANATTVPSQVDTTVSDPTPAPVPSSTIPTPTESATPAATPVPQSSPEASPTPTASAVPTSSPTASAVPTPSPAASIASITGPGDGSGTDKTVIDFGTRVTLTPHQSKTAPAETVLNAVPDNGGPVRVSTISNENGHVSVDVTVADSKSEAVALVKDAQSDSGTLAVAADAPISIEGRTDNPPSNPLSVGTQTTSSDPQRSGQNFDIWQPSNYTYYGAMPWNRIEYPWKHGRGAGITVAVIDTGVDGTHEDLAGQVLPGFDFVNHTTGARAGWADGNSHGTHVAGIIAAKDNNGIGITGIAPDVKILPIKVLADDGSGFSSTVAEGVLKAVDQGAQILNLSLGSPYPDPVLEQAIAYARAHGVVVVAAGGNIGQAGYITLNGWNYPASYPGVIGVASSDSDCGGVGGEHIDISAKGCRILSTIPGNQYARYSGTSMATPQVAAEIAILMSMGKTGMEATDLALNWTGREAYILAFNCVNAPDWTPTYDHQICTPNGENVSNTHLLYGSGTMFLTEAVRNAAGLAQYAPTGYYGYQASAPASNPAPAPAPAAPGGGGSSSAPSSSGGDSSSAPSGGGGALQQINEVRPAFGPLSGGNTVAIVGYGLKDVTKAFIGGKEASFTVINDAHVDVVIPAGDAPGSVDVSLVISSARGRAFAGGGYTYQATTSSEPTANPTVIPMPTPATPVSPSTPTVTINAQIAKGRIVVSGKATGISPGQVITVYRKSAGAKKFTRVGTTTVNQDATFTVRLPRNGKASTIYASAGQMKTKPIRVAP